jgi:hypothetical protein
MCDEKFVLIHSYQDYNGEKTEYQVWVQLTGNEAILDEIHAQYEKEYAINKSENVETYANASIFLGGTIDESQVDFLIQHGGSQLEVFDIVILKVKGIFTLPRGFIKYHQDMEEALWYDNFVDQETSTFKKFEFNVDEYDGEDEEEEEESKNAKLHARD